MDAYKFVRVTNVSKTNEPSRQSMVTLTLIPRKNSTVAFIEAKGLCFFCNILSHIDSKYLSGTTIYEYSLLIN